MKLINNPKVKVVFNNYPETVKRELLHLRKLILTTADEIEGLTQLEETLKWGEPSYLTKHGSTLRINKKKNNENYAMYFSCSTSLIATFRIIYKNVFEFEGNRAIVFKVGEKIPETDLKACITAALTYHKIKQLPLLGM